MSKFETQNKVTVSISEVLEDMLSIVTKTPKQAVTVELFNMAQKCVDGVEDLHHPKQHFRTVEYFPNTEIAIRHKAYMVDPKADKELTKRIGDIYVDIELYHGRKIPYKITDYQTYLKEKSLWSTKMKYGLQFLKWLFNKGQE